MQTTGAVGYVRVFQIQAIPRPSISIPCDTLVWCSGKICKSAELIDVSDPSNVGWLCTLPPPPSTTRGVLGGLRGASISLTVPSALALRYLHMFLKYLHSPVLFPKPNITALKPISEKWLLFVTVKVVVNSF